MKAHQYVFLLLAVGVLAGCESTLVRQVSYYDRVGDTASARQYLETELQRNPDNTEARYWLGRMLFKDRVFADGRQAFDTVEQQTARFSESIQFILESSYREHLQKGVDAFENKDAEAAVLHLTYATQIRPEYNDGHRLLGYAKTQTGQLSDAALAYRQAVMLDPDDFESWHNMSDIAFVNQDYESARNYALEALKIDPAHPSALRRLAHAHMHLEENEQATQIFEQLLALNTGQDDLRDYAYFLFNTGALEASVPHLETLAAVPSPPIELLKTLSEAYAGLQYFKKVIGVNEQILTRAPDDRAAIGNLIAAHERLGQFEQAKTWQAKLSKLGGEM